MGTRDPAQRVGVPPLPITVPQVSSVAITPHCGHRSIIHRLNPATSLSAWAARAPSNASYPPE